MASSLGDAALDQMLASAGLQLTAAQKAELALQLQALATMKERVRQKRGHMAELAHTFGFNAEDMA